MHQVKLAKLGVDAKNIYIDPGLTGRAVTHAGLTTVPTALRPGDELVAHTIGERKMFVRRCGSLMSWRRPASA